MDSRPTLRLQDPPLGGARIAWSFLAGLLALVGTGLVAAILLPVSEGVCTGDTALNCQLGVLVLGALVAGVAMLGLVAHVFRLGWEWWAVAAGLVAAVPLWSAWVTMAVAVAALALIPALAGAATWTGPYRPRWRPWVIGAAALALLGASVWAVLWG